MVKSYLRYAPEACFGVISSPSSNSILDSSGRYCITSGLEDVLVWQWKQGTEHARWHDADNHSEVTVLSRASNGNSSEHIIAAGYADGSIRLWSLQDNSLIVTFRGHKGAVTSLAFDQSGNRLLSGSKDTDIILWDIVGEVGVFRLRGHKDQITSLHFLNVNENGVFASHILSTSKDTLIKVWDITTQHCIETVVGHRSEIWSSLILHDGKRLITGSSDEELRVWNIDSECLRTKLTAESTIQVEDGADADEIPKVKKSIVFQGALGRMSKDRSAGLYLHPTLPYFACQNVDKTVELFKISSDKELKHKLQRRKKRLQEKAKGSKDIDLEDISLTVADEFISSYFVRASAKIRCCEFLPCNPRNARLQIMAGLTNNSIEFFAMDEKPHVYDLMSCLELPGHRHDVRAVAFSSDDEMILSVAQDAIKVWNGRTHQCMRTISCEGAYPVCAVFVPGNRYVLVGMKAGHLDIYDLWSSSLVERINAHESTLWSIDVRPDKKGFVTGSADKDVKFWDFGAIEDTEYSETARRLTALHMRTLRMSDDVLCVKYSPNQALIAISLLDSTIKVFYHDSLKFYLSLYGHKLPVLSMDISSDSALLVSGSADKNVKLWGLDFGDCHKSIFAHQDSILKVQFVHDTHYFFSCSKDKTIKYFDGDKFEQIQKLDGHHGEVWAMAINRWGTLVVTGSHDKSIRLWCKTDEQLFLEEEREKEDELVYEQELLDGQDAKRNALEQEDEETGIATKRTLETMKAGERILEAIELAEQEIEKRQAYEQSLKSGITVAAPETDPLLKALGIATPEEYVLRIVEKVKSSELEQSLMVLPFGKTISLLRLLDHWVKMEWNTPLTSRIILFLLQTYHNVLTANRSVGDSLTLKPLIESIRFQLRKSVQEQKDVIGYNMAAMKFVKSTWEQSHSSEFIDWEKEMGTLASQVRSTSISVKNVKKQIMTAKRKIIGDATPS